MLSTPQKMAEPLHLKSAFKRHRVPEALVYQALLVWAQAGHDMIRCMSRGNPTMPLELVTEFEAMSDDDKFACEDELAVCVELAPYCASWGHLKSLYARRAAEEQPHRWPEGAEGLADPHELEREAAERADDDAAAAQQTVRVERERQVQGCLKTRCSGEKDKGGLIAAFGQQRRCISSPIIARASLTCCARVCAPQVTERRHWEAEEAALADVERKRAAAAAAFAARTPFGEGRDRLREVERQRAAGAARAAEARREERMGLEEAYAKAELRRATAEAARLDVVRRLAALVEAQRAVLSAPTVADPRSPLHRRTRHGSLVASPLAVEEPCLATAATGSALARLAAAFFGSPFAIAAAVVAAGAGGIALRIAEVTALAATAAAAAAAAAGSNITEAAFEAIEATAAQA